MKVHPKVLQDLEFGRVLEAIADKTRTHQAAELILSLRPTDDPDKIRRPLQQIDEYMRSEETGNTFPSRSIEPIREELAKIKTENYFAEPETFLRIAALNDLAFEWKKFLKTFGDTYPLIKEDFEKLRLHREISREIKSKILPSGEIKDTASEKLAEIRRKRKNIRIERDKLFHEAVKKYEKAGYLNEIKESYVDDRPVLAVNAGFVKMVQGEYAGTSRSGNIIFMEPDETRPLNKQLARLAMDERAEIIRILQQLTAFLRPFVEDLLLTEDFFITMDAVRAKALYALETGAVLPEITEEKTIDLRKAYHPLLLTENRKAGLPVIPQNIRLTPQQRILVISGPNAGGKSITLKTAGLLQLMIQSGLPVPVAPGSRFRFFKKILTDIGDNQSIENQLSTYSYRLRNMRLFLRLADEDTFLLIDEFGTGSDPELGGALAEVFLEIFNRKKAYGVITTHYNNLKLLAEKLDGTVNAHMEFDMQTLSPTYKLHIGQPGSSHTFEVARKMGIPRSIIQRAQQKTDRKKVKFDKTLAEMQRKLKSLHEQMAEIKQEREELQKQTRHYQEKEYLLLKKLDAFRELYETESKILDDGKRIRRLMDEYMRTRDKRKLWKQLIKWFEKEGAKQAAKPVKKPVKMKKLKEEIRREIRKENIREKLENLEVKRKNFTPEIGDRVRMEGSKSPAVIKEIKGLKAVLDYGKFTAEVPLKSLELIQKHTS